MAKETVHLRTAFAAIAILISSAVVSGQVVIDMPAPKKPSVKQAAHPPVGDIALKRYAAARTEPYDTYGANATYSSLNTNFYYGYPFYWGFGFGWPVIITPVGGHGHGHHGSGGGHHGGDWDGGHFNLTAPNFGMTSPRH